MRPISLVNAHTQTKRLQNQHSPLCELENIQKQLFAARAGVTRTRGGGGLARPPSRTTRLEIRACGLLAHAVAATPRRAQAQNMQRIILAVALFQSCSSFEPKSVYDGGWLNGLTESEAAKYTGYSY